jgi:hypothetical protein
MKRYFDTIPLMAIPICLYSILAAIAAGSRGVDVFTRELETASFTITMPSGAPWGISGGTLLVALGLVILFFELIRGVASSRFAIIHHTWAVLIALASLGAFMILDSFATSTFFLLSLMCILDMIGGIIVNIAEASTRGGGSNGD